MPIYVFGQDDTIGVPRLSQAEAGAGADITYTRPSYDWFYSKHGFAIPLDYEGMAYRHWMDDTVPLTPFPLKRPTNHWRYLLVDHQGLLWRVTINQTADGKEQFCFSVYTDAKSWWIAVSNHESDMETGFLTGLLYTNPSRKAIEEFWYKYKIGTEVEWLSIKKIVEKLNKDFPKDDKDTEIDGDLLVDLIKSREERKKKKRGRVPA